MLTKPGDEEGSLVIAVTVMLVLLMLTVGVLARSMSSETQVRRNQDFNAALAAADAGIADALFQLDQEKEGTFSKSTPVPVGGGNSFVYQATQALVTNTAQLDPNKYVIHAIGTTNNVKHGVMVTAKRRQRFDYALFANKRLTINGSCPDTFGPVGSSGVVVTNPADQCTPETHCYLDPDTGLPAETSNGCGDSPAIWGGNNKNDDGRHVPETNPKPTVDETLAEFAKTMSPVTCPSTWESTGTISGPITGHTDGYYVCNRTAGFTLSGTVSSANGLPVRIFLMTGNLTLANAVQVNVGGSAVNFQLYVKHESTTAATGGMIFRGSAGIKANYVGALYAPKSYFRFSNAGSGTEFKGSLIADTIEVNGAPNLGYLDQSLEAITIESWAISDYQEVPSSCPISATTC